jgi:hypothetical protein
MFYCATLANTEGMLFINGAGKSLSFVISSCPVFILFKRDSSRYEYILCIVFTKNDSVRIFTVTHPTYVKLNCLAHEKVTVIDT